MVPVVSLNHKDNNLDDVLGNPKANLVHRQYSGIGRNV